MATKTCQNIPLTQSAANTKVNAMHLTKVCATVWDVEFCPAKNALCEDYLSSVFVKVAIHICTHYTLHINAHTTEMSQVLWTLLTGIFYLNSHWFTFRQILKI